MATKIKVYISDKTQQIYFGKVSHGFPENYKHKRTGDLFSISEINRGRPQIVRVKYNDFLFSKDSTSEEFMSFDSADKLDAYFNTILNQKSLLKQFPIPIIYGLNVKLLSINDTSDVILECDYAVPDSIVTIEGLEIIQKTFVNSRQILLKIKTNSLEKSYGLKLSNGSGSTTYENIIKVEKLTWIDLRNNVLRLTDGFEDGVDIRYKRGMSMAVDENGLSFNGNNPWRAWVKFEKYQWDSTIETKTLSFVFTKPGGSFMIGISSDKTDENSSTQYYQGEVHAFFNSGNNFWGLYGNSGTPGSGSTNRVGITVDYPAYRVVFENNGRNGEFFKLYGLPSKNLSDWDSEENELVNQLITGNVKPNQQNIMPVIISRQNDIARFMGIKLESTKVTE